MNRATVHLSLWWLLGILFVAGVATCSQLTFGDWLFTFAISTSAAAIAVGLKAVEERLLMDYS